jgi:small-conductance mechanosensitive channel
LNTIGVNLSGLAIFSGAIGVGVGFGLQKVASNLISGVILLLDQSIKPGDVIEVGESTGVITRLNARYASVTTSDGIEFLIPNEDLITERVTNWTYSNNLVRLRAPVSVSYQSDLHEVIRVCVEATKRAPRVLDNPAPKCQLKRFGPSALELEILFWINDARNGTSGVFGAVLLSVWEAFRAHGIQFADTTYLAELIVSSLGPHAANAPGIASAAD